MTMRRPGRPAPMLGGGFYNRHSRLQSGGSAFALPMIAPAIAGLPQPLGVPAVIADYGCAQGGNSLQPVGLAVAALRERIDAEAPVCVVHVDQPDNDFATLFHLIEEHEASYRRVSPRVFASAVGRSHFEQVLPDDTVSFGWCAFAVHWLSRAPVSAAGHLWGRMAPPPIRTALAAQSAEDWRTFLRCRARELRSGAALLVVQPTVEDEAATTFPVMMAAAQAQIEALAASGVLRPAERERLTVWLFERTPEAIRAPFAAGDVAGLALVEERLDRRPDPYWAAYRENGDAAALAAGQIGFIRAAFGPSLLAALDADRSASEREGILSDLLSGLEAGMAASPSALLEPLTVHAGLIVKR
ncbi:class I SAM-dependent methyltransferase [Ancylobacter lacus]|uniref:hypothetical protein n=1 Tax=Ancylobacter lacus TaxID=2579970 RepID=UPI001BCFE8D0|nr:hypothetical protein [Ancylobacter lacus]MBS7537655.1 hypothetical protein [Ancylobacter lacus]